MFLSVTIEDAKKEARKEARKEALAEGLAKGIAKGRAEERQLFIRNMIQNGLSDEVILKTGVTTEELEKAKKN